MAIFSDFESIPDSFSYGVENTPVWKHLTSDDTTIVRGYSASKNNNWIHMFKSDCRELIDCFEVSLEMIGKMD